MSSTSASVHVQPRFLFLEPRYCLTWKFPRNAAKTTAFAVPHEDYLFRKLGHGQVDPASCLEIARACEGQFDYVVGDNTGGFLWHALFRLAGNRTPFLLVPRINHVTPEQCYALLLSSQLRGPRDLLFAGCRAAGRSFRRFGFRCEPRFLPGIDLKLFRSLPCRAELRAELGLPVDRDILLYTGRVDRDKNILELLEILAAVRTERQAELVICFKFHNKPYLTLCRECAEIAGDVRFVERPDPEILVRYYNAADLFVSAGVSVCETFGRSPVEAMACGTPPVVSDYNGFRDTVTSATGFLVPTVCNGWPQKPDVDRFAATILTALADSGARRKAACASVKRARRWDRVATLKHLLELLANDVGGDAPRRDRLSLAEYPPEIAALWGCLEGQPLADLVTRFVATGELPCEPSRGAEIAFCKFWFADY